MPSSSYVTTKQEQVSETLFCIQSKALSVTEITEIYSRAEGLDISMSFYFLLVGKRTKIYICVHVEGAVSCLVWFGCCCLVFLPEKKLERQVFFVLSSFLEGNHRQPRESGRRHSCLMRWKSGLIHWLCPCENRMSCEHLKAVSTGEGLQKHFTGAFSEPSNKIGFNKAKQKRLK